MSVAVSTIGSVLIGKMISLDAVVVLFLGCAVLCFATLVREYLHLRSSGSKWKIGWSPLGGKALTLACVWVAVAILILVDLQNGHRLYLNLTIFDHASRVNWTESILRTGIPPANSLYFYEHLAPMRNYYFWYVLCAVVARIAHLPVRDILMSSCIWSGFVLVALFGLYLKHFLEVGVRLRKQFLFCVFLVTVSGLDICVNLWDILYLHQPLPGAIQAWIVGQVPSWLSSLLFVPHHVASMMCCLLAFLLAWMAERDGGHWTVTSVALISAALASAFGLSVYVSFAFFLVMLAWALWQVFFEHTPRRVLLIGAGGAGAIVLLLPYLWELTHSSSGIHGGSVFEFAVREMVPPDGLLSTRLFQYIASGHPLAALNIAKLILLAPGYAVELGCYFAVTLIYLIPSWRGRAPLSSAQRSLVFIVAATMVLISLVRSGVLEYNDFGWRGSLPLQFAVLLLASELITGWKEAGTRRAEPADSTPFQYKTPEWLRAIVSMALIVGFASTFCQALMLRFDLPLVESAHVWRTYETGPGNLSHKAYISAIGYAELDASIPRDAIVQYNPASPDSYWNTVDQADINHQMAISGDKPWCGAELGGDPSGCPIMAADIDHVFTNATAEQARATCRRYGIEYLVARIYDRPWWDKNSWVWTLSPVVADDEFRALDCR